MTTTASRTVPGFWRCSACNTPNPSASYLTKCLGCGRPIPPYPSPEPASEKTISPAGVRGRKTLVGGLVYSTVVLASIGLIRGMSLGWWPVAALCFVPRWLFLLPIVPLAIGASRSRKTAVWGVVIADLLLVIGPLMGFVVPVSRFTASPPTGSKVRVLTINPGGATLDATRLIRYLDRQQIDVVCFQEPAPRSGFDVSLQEAGWHFDRERRVASRLPIVKDLGPSGQPFRFCRVKLKHPDGFDFVVGSVHLGKPRRAFERLMARDLEGFRLNLSSWDEEVLQLRELMADSGSTPLIVAGDFNMPSDSQRLVSLRSTYPSAFDQAGWGYGNTRSTSWPWVRVDHVVASRDWSFTRSWVGPELGSDHLPLIAEAVLPDRKPLE